MKALVPLSLFVLLASCDQHPPANAENASEDALLSLELSVRQDGTASPVWTEGIAIAIGDEAAEAFARESIPLSPHAAAWLGVLEDALPRLEERVAEVAALFDVPLMNALVVVGNRGSSDGFGWVPDHIGINVQAFAETYGPPNESATDRMIRIVAHEYLHLLTYAFYPNHRELRQTPLDRALWTIFFEGIGDYVSVSRRWHPDEHGEYSQAADDTLKKLEPIFVERLEKLATAADADERELRTGISMGKFDRKWGSLTFALWLHSEVKRCGEQQTLQTVIRMERDSVLSLALRYAGPEFKTRLEALQGLVGRESAGSGCLATVYRPK
jgi:hypothetical protein